MVMVHLFCISFLVICIVVESVSRENEWAQRFHQQALQLVHEERYDLGLAHFRAACRWRNDSALYWNDLGVTEMRMGLYALAKKRFLKALSLDPKFELAHKNIDELKYFTGGDHPQLITSPIASNALLRTHIKVPPRVLSHGDFLKLGTALPSYAAKADSRAFVNSILSAPFIVQDAFALLNISNSKLEAVFNRKFLTTRYGHERVDFYPHNMKEESAHPYFLNFGSALYQLLNKPEEVYVGVDASEPGTYIQWNLDLPHWNNILQELGATLPGILNDTHWTDQCFRHPNQEHETHKWTAHQTLNQMGETTDIIDETATPGVHAPSAAASATDSTSTPALDILSQFYLSTHWQMLLIGEDQAGMFNHMDTLRTASWQLQLVNSKKWHLCIPEMSPFLYSPGEVDMFHVDYSVHPLVLNASCYEVELQPGEILYYPADFWHQTVNLGTPSIALSSTLVTPLNYKHVIEELRKECTNDGLQRIFPYDQTMCTMLEQCYAHWSDKFSIRT